MPQSPDVVVVGAGVVGSAIAYELSRAGLRVVLAEREGIASGASTHATGSFSLLGADFQNEPHLRLAMLSYRIAREQIPELEALTGVRTLFQRRPGLRLALDDDEARYVRERPAWHEAIAPARWIDADEVRRIEPRLSPSVRGAMWEDESGQVDSARFTLALATGAERLGATILLRRATGLERHNGRVTGVRLGGETLACGTVVLAMGLWAQHAAPWLDLEIPVRPLWGERLLLELDGPPLGALISSPLRGHMISRLDGYLSVGSTAGRDFDDQQRYLADLPEDESFLATPTAAALAELLQRAAEVLPAVEDARLVRQLAGYRPLSPDRLPLIGPVPGVEGAYLATGHGTKGIHLATGTARLITDLVTGRAGQGDIPLAPLDPARFGARPTPPAGRGEPMTVSED
jgi:glycine oxidase